MNHIRLKAKRLWERGQKGISRISPVYAAIALFGIFLGIVLVCFFSEKESGGGDTDES